MEIGAGNTRLKSRRLQDDGAQLFLCYALSLPIFLYLFHYYFHYFSFVVMLITSVILPLAGRLKVIALASAVGVSAGLITLTVAIMIR